MDCEKEEKKEIQGKITAEKEKEEIVTEEEFNSILRRLSPGTNMRSALDGALKAGKGALAVVENEKLIQVMDGGFKVNCKFTPQRFVELCKMDGAIILSRDLKKIIYANVLLTPTSKIKTSETGTRHKAAERTAKQISDLVIAISERKKEINVFYKNVKYHLKMSDEILREVTSKMQILEKHKEIFDSYIEKLNKTELKNISNLENAIKAIQKGKIIIKISSELKKKVIELGEEGILIKTRLKEMLEGIESETGLIIKDYTRLDLKKSKLLLDSLTYEELMEKENILKLLDYEHIRISTQPKGWRILSKTSLEQQEINQLIKEIGNLSKIINSSSKNYLNLLGIEKSNTFKEEINKIKLYGGADF
jgi:diadenylate cyclase